MLCICGLGNPGQEYQHNRHNIGFKIVDFLKQEFDLPKFESKFSGKLSKGSFNNHTLFLFKPGQFMNRSGYPIQLLYNFYKMELDNLMIIHDELELPFGQIKTKKGGGSAGHNGIRSIDSCLGKDYWRLRIGIGKPDHSDIAGYVLSDFSPEEALENIYKASIEHLKSFLKIDQ